MHARTAILAMTLLIACGCHEREARISLGSSGVSTTAQSDGSMRHEHTWEITMPAGAQVGMEDVTLVDSNGRVHKPKRMGTTRSSNRPDVVTPTFELDGGIKPVQLRIGKYTLDVGSR